MKEENQPTFRQLMLIKRIEDVSGYEFNGKTKQEASRWISAHIDVLSGGGTEDALADRYNGGGR